MTKTQPIEKKEFIGRAYEQEKLMQISSEQEASFNPKKKRTIHKVLITSEGASDALLARAYFDQVITLDDIATAF